MECKTADRSDAIFKNVVLNVSWKRMRGNTGFATHVRFRRVVCRVVLLVVCCSCLHSGGVFLPLTARKPACVSCNVPWRVVPVSACGSVCRVPSVEQPQQLGAPAEGPPLVEWYESRLQQQNGDRALPLLTIPLDKVRAVRRLLPNAELQFEGMEHLFNSLDDPRYPVNPRIDARGDAALWADDVPPLRGVRGKIVVVVMSDCSDVETASGLASSLRLTERFHGHPMPQPAFAVNEILITPKHLIGQCEMFMHVHHPTPLIFPLYRCDPAFDDSTSAYSVPHSIKSMFPSHYPCRADMVRRIVDSVPHWIELGWVQPDTVVRELVWGRKLPLIRDEREAWRFVLPVTPAELCEAIRSGEVDRGEVAVCNTKGTDYKLRDELCLSSYRVIEAGKRPKKIFLYCNGANSCSPSTALLLYERLIVDPNSTYHPSIRVLCGGVRGLVHYAKQQGSEVCQLLFGQETVPRADP